MGKAVSSAFNSCRQTMSGDSFSSHNSRWGRCGRMPLTLKVASFIARILSRVPLDPRRAGRHVLVLGFARVRVVELPFGIEELRRAADVGLRLLHRGDVEKHEGLAQVMVRA